MKKEEDAKQKADEEAAEELRKEGESDAKQKAAKPFWLDGSLLQKSMKKYSFKWPQGKKRE
eukprot:12407656-Karenia_brevis.AAC.1